MMVSKRLRGFAATVVAALAVSGFGQITLTDGNSTVEIDPNTQFGMYNWYVDGVDQLHQQWYWYRIGNVAEASIDTIGGLVITPFGANGVNILYSNAVLSIDVTYLLIGGSPGSGTADVAEIVRVRNRTNTPLDFHLFEYDDFDLNGTPVDDFAQLTTATTISQWDPVSGVATVGVVPVPANWEIDSFPVILGKLNDGVPTNLSNSGSPFGPGDATFAFQWSTVIPAYGSFIISKDKLIVPEPATVVSLGGLGLLALMRRRRK